MISATDHRDGRARHQAGAYDFAEKPLSLEKTLILVKNAIDARRLRMRILTFASSCSRRP